MANPLGVNGASKRGRPLADAMRVELLADDKRKLKQLANVVINLALAGEAWAAQLVLDRIDGRVPQPISGADGDGPVKLQIEWKLSPLNDLAAQPVEQLPAPEPGVQPLDGKPTQQVLELTRKSA